MFPNRRQFLSQAGCGFGMIALSALLQEEGLLPRANASQGPATIDPLAPRIPHYKPRAKRVLFLFMSGGPSHLETFDPKPDLQRLHGQRLPASFGPVKTRRGVDKNRLLGTKRTFRKYGKSGIEVSDFLPNLAGCVDDLCILRGCYGNSVTHPESVYLMNTGSILMGRPSLGAWVTYGLGTENRNLPAFVVLPDPAGWVKGGAPAWGPGFLPAAYQGTLLRGGKSPLLHLRNPQGVTKEQQKRSLDLITRLNREHLRTGWRRVEQEAKIHQGSRGSSPLAHTPLAPRAGNGATPAESELNARIAAYELAFRMQTHASAIVDLTRETRITRTQYGLDHKETAEFGTRCLLARRLLEAGVRFVQVYCGDTNGWDGHSNIEANHGRLCRQSDRPIATLLKDLKARGLLEDTLVIWGGEFGRTPMSEGGTGRDHNPHGFTMWLAGGGIKGGQVIGSTDAVGLRAEHDRTHVHDIHATILHLLGFDHTELTFRHNGRNERLTENAGEIVRQALA